MSSDDNLLHELLRRMLEMGGHNAQMKTAEDMKKLLALLEKQLPKPKTLQQKYEDERKAEEEKAYQERIKCKLCQGTGKYQYEHDCKTCSGSGRIIESKIPYKLKGTLKPITNRCDTCRGTGGIGNSMCYSCGGTGEKILRESYGPLYTCPH